MLVLFFWFLDVAQFFFSFSLLSVVFSFVVMIGVCTVFGGMEVHFLVPKKTSQVFIFKITLRFFFLK